MDTDFGIFWFFSVETSIFYFLKSSYTLNTLPRSFAFFVTLLLTERKGCIVRNHFDDLEDVGEEVIPNRANIVNSYIFLFKLFFPLEQLFDNYHCDSFNC